MNNCIHFVVGKIKTISAVFTIFAVLVLSSFSNSIGAEPVWKSSELTSQSGPQITIYVNTAYYADLDGDGYEDDIYTQVELHLSGANRYNFDYWLTLTLPSGTEFVFGWGINTRLTYLLIGNNLYDTALETGWYTLHVEVVLKTGGVTYIDEIFTFDPPGDGREGIKPTASFAIEDSS